MQWSGVGAGGGVFGGCNFEFHTHVLAVVAHVLSCPTSKTPTLSWYCRLVGNHGDVNRRQRCLCKQIMHARTPPPPSPLPPPLTGGLPPSIRHPPRPSSYIILVFAPATASQHQSHIYSTQAPASIPDPSPHDCSLCLCLSNTAFYVHIEGQPCVRPTTQSWLHSSSRQHGTPALCPATACPLPTQAKRETPGW